LIEETTTQSNLSRNTEPTSKNGWQTTRDQKIPKEKGSDEGEKQLKASRKCLSLHPRNRRPRSWNCPIHSWFYLGLP
jgi:hypothetical protein